ncbi:putative rlpA-like protein, double-psi beta-barrel [Helianthus annuus]|nr:putative EG45-like domain containing protein, plant [Helianthus annuus]KAJ0943618.1 putative rlpA-like protein, double-psi beta-barrel [Helianthus annuus]
MFCYIVITASACYGYQDQGAMIAAANQDLWQGGAVCGKYFQVTCTGALNQGVPHPCTSTPTVTVMITDFCPPPGCKGNLDLSHEAFSTIADPSAGGVKISYQQYAIQYVFFKFCFDTFLLASRWMLVSQQHVCSHCVGCKDDGSCSILIHNTCLQEQDI